MLENLKLQLQPYMMAIKIAAIVAVFLSGCYVTHLYYANKLSAAIIATRKAEAALAAKGTGIEIKYIKEVSVIEKKGATRIVEVIKYVPIDKITEGFIEFHNAAVDNRPLKEMTDVQINTLSDKTMQDAAKVISSNYDQCNIYIKQIDGLQEYIREVEKAK